MSTYMIIGFVLFLFVAVPLAGYLWRKAPLLLPGVFVLFLGVLLNMVVTCANGYKMPVVVSAFDSSANDALHHAANEKTRLVFLADHIEISSRYFNEKYVYSMSVGDICIRMGAVMMIVDFIFLMVCYKFPLLFPKITESMRE